MKEKDRAKILVSFTNFRERDLPSIKYFEGKLKFSGAMLVALGFLAAFINDWPRWISPAFVIVGCASVIWGIYSSVYREAWQVIEPYLTESEIERLKKVASEP